MIFFIKIFLRFFVGNYNVQLDDTKAEIHQKQVIFFKEEIILCFQLIFQSLSDQNLIADISMKILPYVIENFKNTLSTPRRDTTIIYLNFLKFLCFQTNLSSSNRSKREFFKFIIQSNFLNILAKGLLEENLFIIQEIDTVLISFNYMASENICHPDLTYILETILNGYLTAVIEWDKKKQSETSLKTKEHIKFIEVLLLNGVQKIYQYYLGESTQEQIQERNIMLTMFTLGIVQGQVQQVINFKKDPNTCQNLLQKFPNVFSILKNYWVTLNVVKDTHIYSLFQKNKLIVHENHEKFGGMEKGVLDIISPFTNFFKKNLIEILLEAWISNNIHLNPKNFHREELHQGNNKILDIILSLNIPFDSFMEELKQTEKFKKVLSLKRYKKFKVKRYYYLDWVDCAYETNLLSFLFCYIKYSRVPSEMYQIAYSKILDILRLFEETLIPSSLCWIMDIVYMCLIKMPFQGKEFDVLKPKYIYFLTIIIGNLTRL